jgi:hypothetical protein
MRDREQDLELCRQALNGQAGDVLMAEIRAQFCGEALVTSGDSEIDVIRKAAWHDVVAYLEYLRTGGDGDE